MEAGFNGDWWSRDEHFRYHGLKGTLLVDIEHGG